jgi:hypothetical protein
VRWRAPDLTPEDHAALDAIDGLDWDGANWRFVRDWEEMQEAERQAEAGRSRRKRGRKGPETMSLLEAENDG